jgi:two-component system NtrC family sensor kinase
MDSAYSTIQERRRDVVLLRSLLLVAVGGLLVGSGVRANGPAALVVLGAFLLTNGVLLFSPLRLVRSFRFDLVLGVLDTVLVIAGIHLAGQSRSALPVSCLLMAGVVALGSNRFHAVAGAATVSALHGWFVLGHSSGAAPGPTFALQVLLLCSVGLYFGYLVEGLHRVRRERDSSSLTRRELVTLLEILDAVNSSLDLEQVTRTVVSKIATIIPVTRCSILFVDRPTRRAYVLASHDDPELDMLEIDLGKYPEVRKAIETRSSVLVEDIASDPLLDEVREYLRDLAFSSIMVIPLTFCEDVLGTLCIRTARKRQRFSEREMHFCTAVARASANALQNALLHRQITEESAGHRRTGRMLSSVLDHSPDLIFTTDENGLIAKFNHGAERMLGYRKDDILGRSYETLFEEDAGGDLVARCIDGGEMHRHACQLRQADGRPRDLELNIAALRDEDDRAVGTVWLGRDISELKNTQLQLLQAEKLSTIGEVISGVAHELNNPLSGVLGFSQLLMGRHEASPLSSELEKIHDAALRCQKIVKNLLAFARGHVPARKYLGANGIILKTLDLKKYQLHVKDIEVETDLEPELPRTLLDFHQIQQVLLNLINNAEHAITAVPDRPGRLTIRTSSDGGEIRIEVTDNGTGMDPRTLDRIFDPFFSTKEQGEGTGLGLSVSYGIVQEHRGRIWAESRPGEGTTFVIGLPIRGGETREATEPEPVATVAPSAVEPGGRVLVVDDEPMILDLLIDILESAGHRVDSAANGSEACRKIGEGDYDVILSDMRMPQMSGMELYRRTRELRPEMAERMIFMSGDLIDKETIRFLEETGAAAVAKPVDIPEILQTVSAALRRASASPQPV